MSSRNRKVQVRMVRIQWQNEAQPQTHHNAMISIQKSQKTNVSKLEISFDDEIIINEDLKKFQWLDQSSVDGVATIDSSSKKIIIIYDGKNKDLRDFFIEMKNIINQKTIEPPPPPPPSPPPAPIPQKPLQTTHSNTLEQTTTAVNDLVQYIENGASSQVNTPTKYLAQSGTNIEFNLTRRLNNDNQNANTTKNSTSGSLPNALQLKLQIECHLDGKPIVETIYVRPGTKLSQLKEQIHTDTGIHRNDQYWYAFERHLIKDDYIFGSNNPVVPPLPNNAPKNQKPPPSDPIRSGDTLIMCIAQIPPA